MGARWAAAAVTVLLAGAVLGACGGDGSSEGAGRSGTEPPGRSGTEPARDAAAAYVGLTEAAAVAKAEDEGRPWRIGREDDEEFLLTQDLVENRVTFELDGGVVTKATLG